MSVAYDLSIDQNNGVAIAENQGTVNFYQHGGQEREQILTWLSDVPYRSHHRRMKQKIIKGTAEWILLQEDFQKWNLSSDTLNDLVLFGSPGSGKSCLTARIIEACSTSEPRDSSLDVVYFYCAYNQADPKRSDPLQILLCLIRQLLESMPDSHASFIQVKERYKTRASMGSFDFEEATEIIQEILDEREKPMTLILDALDECNESSRYQLINLILDLRCDHPLFRVFVSSRREGDIVESFNGWPSIQTSKADSNADIALFVAVKVDEVVKKRMLLKTSRVVPQELVSRIKSTLIEGSDGMFRWVEASIDFLCSLNTRAMVEAKLGTLPTSLRSLYKELYDHKFANRDSTENDMTCTVFSLLLCSRRLLSPDELTYLMSSRMRSESVVSITEMLHLCFNFVAVDPEGNYCTFFHASVRDFLTAIDDYKDVSGSHGTAAIACLHLIELHPVRHEDDEGEVDDERKVRGALLVPHHFTDGPSSIEANPLLFTSGTAPIFIRNAESSAQTLDFAPSKPDPTYREAMEWSCNISEDKRFGQSQTEQHPIIYTDPKIDTQNILARPKPHAVFNPSRGDMGVVASTSDTYEPRSCFRDLVEVVPHIEVPKSSAFGGRSTTAMIAQSLHMFGSKSVNSRLHRRQARYYERKFFDYADESWHYHFQQALLSPMQPETVESLRRIVLRNENNGRERWISRLDDKLDSLDHGRGFNEKHMITEPPNGIFVVCVLDLDFLFDECTDLYGEWWRCKNIWGATPLVAACVNGSVRIVKRLLSRLSSIDEVGDEMTPLQIAAFAGREELIRLILDRGASIDFSHNVLGTALQVAVSQGNSEAVQVLIDAGADTTLVSDDTYLLGKPVSLLGIASYYKQVSCVETLLKARRCIDRESLEDAMIQNTVSYFREDHFGGNSNGTSSDAHAQILAMLLARLEASQSSAKTFQKALCFEAVLGHGECVQRLLSALPLLSPLDLMIACYYASLYCQAETTAILLENTVMRPQPKIISHGLSCMLAEASQYGTPTIVQTILSQTVPDDFTEDAYISALQPSQKVLEDKWRCSQRFLQVLKFMPSRIFEKVFDGLVYAGALGATRFNQPMIDMIRDNFSQRLSWLVSQDSGLSMLLRIRWDGGEAGEGLALQQPFNTSMVVFGHCFVQACRSGLQLALQILEDASDLPGFDSFFCLGIAAAVETNETDMTRILLGMRMLVHSLPDFRFASWFYGHRVSRRSSGQEENEAERLVSAISDPFFEELSKIKQPERGKLAIENTNFIIQTHQLSGNFPLFVPQMEVWSSDAPEPDWYKDFTSHVSTETSSWIHQLTEVKVRDETVQKMCRRAQGSGEDFLSETLAGLMFYGLPRSNSD